MIVDDDTRFTVTVEQGFIRLRWCPHVMVISGEDVQATFDAFEAVSSAGKRPLLVQFDAVTRISPTARQMVIEDTRSTRVAVLSTDLMTKIVTAFTYVSVTPTRFFTDETEAIEWLFDPHPELEIPRAPEAEQRSWGKSGPSD